MVWGGGYTIGKVGGVSLVFLFTETLATQKIDATVDLHYEEGVQEFEEKE